MAKTQERSAPTEAFTKYRTTFYEQRADLSEEGLRRMVRASKREFSHLLPEDKKASILDIGCGGGAFLLACRELGYSNLQGIDVSEEQIEYCRQHGIHEASCADGIDFLTSTADSFDLVVMLDVLEHHTKDRAFELLRRISERLVPGGKLVFRVPNMSNPLNLRTRYVDVTHELGFSRESLDQVLRLTGFEPELIDSATGSHPNFLPRFVFEVVLWKLFLVFYRRTMRLRNDPLPGKNLIAIAVKPEITTP